MAKKLSNITYMPVVENISRKFALRRETCSTKQNQQGQKYVFQYMGAGTRYKMFNGGKVAVNYFFMRKYARDSATSSSETLNRNNFAAVSAWVKRAMNDLSAVTHNQQIFLASKNEHKTCKAVWAGDYTFRGFMFAVGMAILANSEQLPVNNQLPALDA